MTKAIPGAGGIAWKKFSNARRPPADAPMPTTGNGAALFSGMTANFVGPISRETHEALFKPADFAVSPILAARESGSRRLSLLRVMRTIGAFPIEYVKDTISSATAGL